MNFRSTKIIEELENQIEKGYSLPIFKGYIAINKRGVEKLIAELYATLSIDVEKARQYLETIHSTQKVTHKKECEKKSIYNHLTNLNEKIDTAINISSLIIVNIREIENIINKIHTNIPEEIVQAEKLIKD